MDEMASLHEISVLRASDYLGRMCWLSVSVFTPCRKRMCEGTGASARAHHGEIIEMDPNYTPTPHMTYFIGPTSYFTPARHGRHTSPKANFVLHAFDFLLFHLHVSDSLSTYFTGFDSLQTTFF